MNVSAAAVVGLEGRERRSAATLAALERAADALDCDLVYALVPRRPLVEQVQRQADLTRVRVLLKSDKLGPSRHCPRGPPARLDGTVSSVPPRPPSPPQLPWSVPGDRVARMPVVGAGGRPPAAGAVALCYAAFSVVAAPVLGLGTVVFSRITDAGSSDGVAGLLAWVGALAMFTAAAGVVLGIVVGLVMRVVVRSPRPFSVPRVAFASVGVPLTVGALVAAVDAAVGSLG